MKSSAFKAAIAGACALAAAVSLPAPAYAIDRVTVDCVRENPHGYLYLESQDGKERYCFTNPGRLTGLAIHDIIRVDAGDNDVTIWVQDSADLPFEFAITIQKGAVLGRLWDQPIYKITAIEIH